MIHRYIDTIHRYLYPIMVDINYPHPAAPQASPRWSPFDLCPAVACERRPARSRAERCPTGIDLAG